MPPELGRTPAIRRWWLVVRNQPRRAAGALALALVVLFVARVLLPPAVPVVTLTSRTVTETLVSAGRVRSVSRASVGAPAGGTVAQVLAREGDRVRRGQLLVRVEDAEALAAASGARARLAEAEASLRRLASVTAPSSAAELQAAELEARQRALDLARIRRLYEAGAVSRTDVEQVERTAESAQARYAAARGSAESLAQGGADRRVAEAALAGARGALAVAEARLELTRVRAPADGRVLTRMVEPGDIVPPGRVLMELALDGPTELVTFPDERSLGQLRPGLPAVASADAFPGLRFEAVVAHVAPVVDPQQGTVEVRLAVPDPPAYLVPDMTVSVNIELARRTAAPTLPLDAVRAPLSDTAWVLALRRGRTVPVPVQLGARDAAWVEILGGLQPDERVVVNGGELQPGERARARRRGA